MQPISFPLAGKRYGQQQYEWSQTSCPEEPQGVAISKEAFLHCFI
jgi:hypothetical protein